jgi:hypothetical protein
MSTHAAIGIMHGEKCKSIYLHSDGYLKYAGRVLLANYDSVKAQYLIAQGDCSMLGKEIGEEINFNDRMEYDENAVAKQCRFHKRDRKEDGVDFRVSFSFEELKRTYDANYVYLMKDGVWFVSVGGEPLQPLADVLIACTE